MSARIAAIGALLLVPGLAGCWRPTIRGSGVAKSEERTVGEFERIGVAGSADVTVRIGSPRSVTVTCDDNLLRYVTTKVRDGELEISMERGWFRSKVGVRVEVTAPRIERFSIAGSSRADLSGLTDGPFETSISGSGAVHASGRVERLEARISGSGSMDLDDLEAEKAGVKIAGSGSVDVRASEALSVSITGSGCVRYQGDPRLTKSIVGSGSVVRR